MCPRYLLPDRLPVQHVASRAARGIGPTEPNSHNVGTTPRQKLMADGGHSRGKTTAADPREVSASGGRWWGNPWKHRRAAAAAPASVVQPRRKCGGRPSRSTGGNRFRENTRRRALG